MNRSTRSLLSSPAWWLIVAVTVVEFFLFDHYGSRRVTGFYPRWNDQIQYLSECYTGFEFGRAHGLAAGLWHTLTNPSAQGTLHDFAAVLVFQLVGPSRSAALALNMLALMAWQIALFVAVRQRSGHSSLAILAAMLPLALRGPWENVPGSAYDFRLDHLAMCAIGTTTAVALLTAGFRHRSWSAVFGVATGITLLTRFITGTYFVVIFLVLIVWALTASDRRQRLTNIAIAAVIAIAIALPIFWLNREWVWNYYYIGHYVGPESAIRNQNFGVGRSLQYVFGWLGERHLGPFFGWFAAIAAILLSIGATIPRREAKVPGRISAESFSVEALVCGLIFLCSPALVLTLHPQKSEVVLGALAPGVTLLVIGIWALAVRRGEHARRAREIHDAVLPASIEPSPTPMSAARGPEALIAIVAIFVALGYFGRRQTVVFEGPESMARFRQVNTLADYVLTTADQAKLPVIRVSVDYITDALDAQVLRVVCYERHHVWKDWDMKLPTGIATPDPNVVRQRVTESDFVFLTEQGNAGPFPYDRKLAAMKPELERWCEAHLVLAKRFTLNGRTMALYQRRELPTGAIANPLKLER